MARLRNPEPIPRFFSAACTGCNPFGTPGLGVSALRAGQRDTQDAAGGDDVVMNTTLLRNVFGLLATGTAVIEAEEADLYSVFRPNAELMS